jgi:hypothetical protein
MSYISVVPSAAPSALTSSSSMGALGNVALEAKRAKEKAIAFAKVKARVEMEAQARGKKDATSGAEFAPKLLTKVGIDAQNAGVLPSEVAALTESAYKFGWMSVKPLPPGVSPPDLPTGGPGGDIDLPSPPSSVPLIVAGAVAVAVIAFLLMRKKG